MLPTVSHILYATDMRGEETKKAFAFAASIASAYQADLTLLHVVEPLPRNAERMMETALPPEMLEKVKSSGLTKYRSILEERMKSVYEANFEETDLPMEKIKLLVKHGRPARTILKVAEKINADMIVLGGHKSFAIGNVMLGSVANKVVHRSEIPALVYPL